MSSAVETIGAQWHTTSKHSSSADPVTLDPREGAALFSLSIIQSAGDLFANLAHKVLSRQCLSTSGDFVISFLCSNALQPQPPPSKN